MDDTKPMRRAVFAVFFIFAIGTAAPPNSLIALCIGFHDILV
jgi:hypothetical protein